MIAEKLKTVLAVGETVAVEFKRCGNRISTDTYETVCAFLNSFGSDIDLGVADNSKVSGVPEEKRILDCGNGA
ncbi:ATP-binding protein [Synergistaceae bacterium OttesenSCG-928-I11]|nr:ATP-binding protein [Synergistaceae bacterium OttesenSCG-928-I11]